MQEVATVGASPVAEGERFIFVGGAPRSGTTLVQNMLDSHPEIVGGPEFLHLVDIARLRNTLASSIEKGWIAEFCSIEAMDQAVADLIARLLLPLAERHGARLISEKSPTNILVFKELLELFPRARAIHVVRDPRAVVASMLEVGRKAKSRGVELQPFTRDVRAAVRHVKECYLAGDCAVAMAPDRVLAVAYERLLADPAAETQRICRFLDLPWTEAMLRPGDHPHLGLVPLTEGSGNLWYDRASFQRNPEAAPADRWRTSMAPRDKAVAVVSFRDFEPALRHGYQLGVRTLSPLEHAYGRAWMALRHLKRRLKGGDLRGGAVP
jgi:protein-tyrosine sulfotransferase